MFANVRCIHRILMRVERDWGGSFYRAAKEAVGAFLNLIFETVRGVRPVHLKSNWDSIPMMWCSEWLFTEHFHGVDVVVMGTSFSVSEENFEYWPSVEYSNALKTVKC
ncbi:hypothetical protein AVEN_4517-1 [Araneus ventricosus]|uniref:Uncharacterized protein n=1 Tax=Araneus ventricosus TaxID=182803 RepID=A0A4Y2BM70_ARAVE|nr:hypothetical protein AVEN_4517-1 [Araneus ventricosus]